MDRSLLEAALIGYGVELEKIQERIAAIRQQLGGGRVAHVATSTSKSKPRRKMSASAKKRIAAAQKKRWAEWHAKQGKPAAKKASVKKVAVKKSAPKRKLSPERKAALVANLAKARAARAAKRTAGDKVPF